MKVALLQQNIKWSDAQANLRNAEQAIDQVLASEPETRLIVLPEMFPTGYTMEPEKYADRHHETLHWMQQVADNRNIAVTGSVAVADGGKYYNRMYFVRPNMEPAHYDKRHLFTYSGENLHYAPGHKRTVVEWCGVKFLLMVCYDLRFPVWLRYSDDYDAMLCVASWPASRRLAWDVLLRGRAIENQCYVFGVNRVGNDPLTRYEGGTAAVHPYGTIIGACPDGEQSWIVADIDMEKLNSFRSKFPVLADRDK